MTNIRAVITTTYHIHHHLQTQKHFAPSWHLQQDKNTDIVFLHNINALLVIPAWVQEDHWNNILTIPHVGDRIHLIRWTAAKWC